MDKHTDFEDGDNKKQASLRLPRILVIVLVVLLPLSIYGLVEIVKDLSDGATQISMQETPSAGMPSPTSTQTTAVAPTLTPTFSLISAQPFPEDSIPGLVEEICGTLVAGFGTAELSFPTQTFQTEPPEPSPMDVPEPSTQAPTHTLDPEIQTPTATLKPTLKVTQEVERDPLMNLRDLESVVVPERDLIDLAVRLERKDVVLTTPETPVEYQIGEKKSFWVLDTANGITFQVSATLQYATDHVYFWVDRSIRYDQGALEGLANAFEEDIYSTSRELFGSEPSPGVDNDVHLHIVYVSGLGMGIDGYYSAADSIHPDIRDFSNGHEMFVLNANTVDLSDPYTYGILAHEFQHMIHGNQDPSEDIWLDEGFAKLATLLNGYEVGGYVDLFKAKPDIQLNRWPVLGDLTTTSTNYGGVFLFALYFFERFGEDATKALIANPENGLGGVDSVLRDMEARDPESGELISADDVFGDWVVANYVNDHEVGDGRYGYTLYQNETPALTANAYNVCPVKEWQNRSVSQYGVDYIHVGCQGEFTFVFEGANEVDIFPVEPVSGIYTFWSNRGDESNPSLTQEFDFRDVQAPIEMTFWVWYDLERRYDYVYIMASEDGEKWTILDTPSGTEYDPTGNNYGWGYNGESYFWLEEEVVLSRYAGKVVQLRFEYVSDDALSGDGFLLDDIEIPAIGYSADFELGNDGWHPEGFVRISNSLPQTFSISVIKFGSADTTVVREELRPGQSFTTIVRVRGGIKRIVFAISGTTRYTQLSANYRFRITK